MLFSGCIYLQSLVNSWQAGDTPSGIGQVERLPEEGYLMVVVGAGGCFRFQDNRTMQPSTGPSD
jgi:hypothetical protein